MLGKISLPTFEEFKRCCQDSDVLGIAATIPFDLETPISLADRFVDEHDFFLLESATSGPGGEARFSFLGFDSLARFCVIDQQVQWRFGDSETSEPLNGDPLGRFRDYQSKLRLKTLPVNRQKPEHIALIRQGGFVGYISYDATSYFEPAVGAKLPGQFNLPDIHFVLSRNFMILDQLSRTLTIVRYCGTRHGSADQLRRAYAEEVKAFSVLLNRVTTPHQVGALTIEDEPIDHDKFSHTLPKEQFLKHVDRSLEEIRHGEIYQIQIGNRMGRQTSARPFDLFRHLRILNPSPYMGFYKFGKHHIVCASPEMMVNVQGSKMLHRPIAGTRRRTWDAERDPLIKKELASDEKERSEHVMLVDLARNDIGRVAAPGTVAVDELMVVEEYSHVFHLVSQVSGELAPANDAFDAMRVSFPNGTVTGAPKIRSMQLIREMETVGREFYAGSLALFDFDQNLRSTLLIRTIYMADGYAATQASAGIVYDSVPEHEWQETRNKMAACLLVIQNTR